MTGQPPRRPLTLDDYEAGVLAPDRVAPDRAVLGRAITLIESDRADHQEEAQALLARLLPRTGGALRLGITGAPGVGKSTLIEKLGMQLVARGHRVAVLAVDPTSTVSGGSILGDKTRMTELARSDQAFVRPSPSGGWLGGVARKTRETILLCEAAGFDVVVVETVGVGQSETMVAEMVDCVVLLLLPGAGDELQGIKRGILELIDLVAINKADGENLIAARRTRAQYEAALRYVRPASAGWQPPVMTVSSVEGTGLDELWAKIEAHRQTMGESGERETRRRAQLLRWMHDLVEQELRRGFRDHPGVAGLLPELESKVLAGELPPTLAALRLLRAFRQPAG